MHRIDTPDAVAGQFNDNPSVASPTTRVTAAWMNDVQENIAQAIEAAGIALVKGDGVQLLAAIKALARLNGVPPGTKGEFYLKTAPAGWLPFDGSQYLKADYPALVAAWTADGLLVNGSTSAYFVVPKLEGYFGRAASSDNSIDPGGPRAAGDDPQMDAFANHTHSLPVRDNAGTGNGFIEDADSSGVARTASTGQTGGSETRPKNVALLWCVKY